MNDPTEPAPPDSHTPAAAVVATPAFGRLVRSRNRFAIRATAVGFGAYLVLIGLSGFTTVLSGPAVGDVSWTFALTALVFPLVWLLAGVYTRKAARWDEMADRAIAESGVATRPLAPSPGEGVHE